jgi:excisionase family DNA binding protein
VSPEQRDAYRTVAETLPAGTPVPITREHLLSLLGNPTPVQDEKAQSLLTVEEAANRLNVSEQMVRRLDKQLGTVRIGRAVRIPESGVTRYLVRSRRGS